MIQPRRLRGIAVLAVLLALCALTAPGTARAESVYTVRGISVDSSAVSSAEARAIALAEGQRAALDRLLTRLVLSEDRVLLPSPDDAQIAQLIDGYIIDKELVSSTRYRAELIFDFNKFLVRKMLRQRKIRFAETRSREVLVVPVYDAGEGSVIWQEPGDWRSAWLARPAKVGLVPFILPLGDLMDIAALGAAEALTPAREALLALAARYGVDEVVVAAASLQLSPVPPPSDSSTADDGADGAALSSGAEAELSSSRQVRGPVEGALLQLTVHRVGVAGEHTTSDLLRGGPGESRQELLARAVARVIAQVEGGWKQANMLRFGRENQLRIIVPLAGLPDWVEMRRKLSELAVVVTVDLAAMSRDRAEVLLHYLGETEQLMLGLEQSGLALNFEARGWVLLRQSAGGPQEQGGKNL